MLNKLEEFHISIAIGNCGVLNSKDHDWFIKQEYLDTKNVSEKVYIKNAHYRYQKGELFEIEVPIKYNHFEHDFIKVDVWIE